ncbi:MAG TPA: BrnT family toxin [Chloroflexota bacterium]|nr:BrnT family toxin [Chloroflexota bacterium]
MEGVEVEWDDDNVEHLALHGISPDEVEDMLEGPVIRRRGGTDAPDRFRVLGRTAAGHYLAIVIQQKGRGVIRPFTGWEMRPHERNLYDRQVKD